ncbi:CynX/NimT family MFS transporter [Eoetvoesiella caeni]|uniref:CP family cyanate transporter-like MFS transporter n=1 Tax=Eoetvoesiella caeni TaxID=645616 RepID=A0A366HKH9_9BURK|nr:MFS transporter [Eoetvoesiella caeni]MCI2808255.1 MFS transporter [Eoetvoesiella caeni]NYT53742.1 MFS transporter [Eoetvoesiella caeni]RBP42180.1 CP family cyanate transporter-like MFS transporter [Eoetvoesiella caeni]
MQSNQQKNAARPPASAAASRSLRPKLMLILALFFVAANLRPVLISLGPVLDSVQASLDLSGSGSGLLITLPILCFAGFAPFVPRLLRYWPAERLILWALLVLAAGIAVRSLFGITGLFAGTFISGASISVIMVLLPSIIKDHFPSKAGVMMSLYSTALCLGAAIAAGATVPLQNIPGSSWRWAMAFWLVPALLSALVWRPHIPPRQPQQERRYSRTPRLRSSLLAWQVTLFMGLQSAVAYCVFGWLPFILIDRGLNQVTAGLVLSISLGIQLISSMLAPWMATRGRDQRSTIVLMLTMSLSGMMGLIYAPLAQVWVWSIVLGLGLGGVFSIALALLVLRSPNPQVAAALSGMAQGVGYAIAAVGPFALGLLHELTGDWNGVALLFAAFIIGGGIFGMGAGRAGYIKADAKS